MQFHELNNNLLSFWLCHAVVKMGCVRGDAYAAGAHADVHTGFERAEGA